MSFMWGGGATVYISNPPPPTVLVHDIHITSEYFPQDTCRMINRSFRFDYKRDFLVNLEVGLLYHLDFILPPARNAWFKV